MASSLAPITNHEFKLFHSIDRNLYTSLVFGIGRDPAESMQVMAFWIWLERSHYCRSLVHRLLSWPLALLNQLADESIMCLKCVEIDSFFVMEGYDDLALLQSLIEIEISLRHFHQNRVGVVRGVTKIVNEVCAKAFEDILMGPNPNQGNPNPNPYPNPNPNPNPNPTLYHQVVDVPFYPSSVYPSVGIVPQVGLGASDHHLVGQIGGNVHNLDPYDFENQRQMLNTELNELLGRISLTVNCEEENEVSPDDRTIFLTFSKGYPISENEVREFFTKKFGDFIETIYMQEVDTEEQVLYARLVSRSASIIDMIVERGSKSKYSINGKHVWARKYVKKNSRSPPRVNESPVQPSSPVAAPQPYYGGGW